MKAGAVGYVGGRAYRTIRYFIGLRAVKGAARGRLFPLNRLLLSNDQDDDAPARQ